MKNIIFGAPKGGIAQLARALAWHARGREFESHYLHTEIQGNADDADDADLRGLFF